MDDVSWRDLTNGVKVYIPTLADSSKKLKAIPWTNEMRIDKSFKNHTAKLPDPHQYVSEIYEFIEDVDDASSVSACASSDELSEQHNYSKAEIKSKEGSSLHFRVQAKDTDLNNKYYFLVQIKAGREWKTTPSKYKVNNLM